MATQLYDSESQAIYPNTQADAVSVNIDNKDINNVQSAIQDLYQQVANKNGDQAAVSNLTFEISYLVSKISDVNQIKNLDDNQWRKTFQLPDTNNPYAWKRTIIGYTGIADADRKSVYEIVTADIAEISQSLYIAMDNTQPPKIYYPQAYTENNTPYDNLQASITSIITETTKKDSSMVWRESPVSISASAPYGYVATRIRKNGTWTKFVIALNSKWSYDSKMVVKYTYTTSSSSPSIDRTKDNPGNTWVDQVAVTGTGYLWMITATRVSTNYAKDDSENIWSAPQLISVIQ